MKDENYEQIHFSLRFWRMMGVEEEENDGSGEGRIKDADNVDSPL